MNGLKAAICIAIISALMAGCSFNRQNDNVNETDNNGPLGVRYNPADNNRDNIMDDDRGTNQYGNISTNDNGVINNNGRDGNKGNMRSSDEAADKVAKLDEVENATVIVTDHTAYAAVMLSNNQKKLTKDIEKKIADTVRKSDKSIDKVYVSVNPDFYDRFTGYGDELRKGNPVSGLYDEFSQTVRRVFPTAH